MPGLALPILVIAIVTGLLSLDGIAGIAASIIRFLLVWFACALVVGIMVGKLFAGRKVLG